MDPASTTAGVNLVHSFGTYGYLALLFLFIIEGPVVGMTSGVLISVGALEPVPVLLLYTISLIITDTAVYYLGKKGTDSIYNTVVGRKLFGRVQKVISQADSDWRRRFTHNYFSLMVIANLIPINLLGTFVAFGAGMLQIPERDFYKPVVISRPIWATAVVGFGFYLGGAVTAASNMVSKLSLFAAVIACVWLFYTLYLREKIMLTPLGRLLQSGKSKQ